MDESAGSVLARCNVVPACYPSGVGLDKYLQFPEVFAPKVKDSDKTIEGFLQKQGSGIDAVELMQQGTMQKVRLLMMSKAVQT